MRAVSKRTKIVWVILGLLLISPLLVVGVLALCNGRVGIPTDFSDSPRLANPPPAWTTSATLKVATFNIQDLYLVGKDRPLRMRSIGAKLLIMDPDIVGFQEAFVAKDRAVLLKELESTRLKYHQYYPSGTAGSGLLIASAFPIEEVYFHRFTVSNPSYKLNEGDWWAGKGVALARIDVPGIGALDFYNTHAQAGYGNPAYDIVRKTQMEELATFVTDSQSGTVPAFVVGDMNCRPGDEDFAAAVDGANLIRAMVGESRIDHIFVVDHPVYRVETIQTEPIEAQVKLGDKEISLSDHIGYMSTVVIHLAQDSTGDESEAGVQ